MNQLITLYSKSRCKIPTPIPVIAIFVGVDAVRDSVMNEKLLDNPEYLDIYIYLAAFDEDKTKTTIDAFD